MQPAIFCPIDIPGLKHLFKSVECAGIFHSHSFLIHYLNTNENSDLTNELKFGMTSGAFEQLSPVLMFLHPCRGHQLQPPSLIIVWSLLGIKEWDVFQVMKPRWDDMELNHLILNVLTLLINKIDATGAITMSAFYGTLSLENIITI
jgi:hypothetical protein